LDFAENVFPPLEPKLLVMFGRIGEALLIVYEVLCTLSSANGSGARECAPHHGMALESFSANW
jgi:hypothetical protein